jgi:DNA-binding XRE family transcriptional regulator
VTGENVVKLTFDARIALGLNQRTLGEALGVSKRTVQRWDARQGQPFPWQLAKIATLVASKDVQLAAKIAAAGGTSLEQLGIDAPPVVAPLPAAPRTPLQRLVDVVVCAAAEALAVAPQSVRPALLAAFTKARDVDLTIDEVASVLGVSENAKRNSKKRR